MMAMTVKVPLTETWTIVDGRPIFARVSVDHALRDAVPIVHIHGFAISGSYMVPTAERLATHYPTYVPDLPGYGRSIKPDHTLSITELADALKDYLDAIGVQKAVLVGNSMGCLIALEFARKYRDRIERAIMVSPAGGPNNQPIVRGLPQLALDSVRESPKMYIVAVPDYLKFGLINALRLFHAMTQFPTIDRFLHLTCPTLVVVGVRDPLISKERFEAALDLPLGFTLVYHNKAAHAINYSHPVELATLIRNFIEDQPLLTDLEPTDAVAIVGTSRKPDE